MRLLLVLLLATAALGQPIQAFPQPFQEESWVAWSPAGHLLTVHHDKEVFVHDLRSKQSGSFKFAAYLYNPTISPDEKTLVVPTYPCHLQVYDLESRQKLWEFQGPSGPQEGSYQVDFSPDGQHFIATSGSSGRNKPDPWTRVFATRTGKVVQKWPWEKNGTVTVGWLPDGTIVKADGKVLGAFDLTTGKKTAQRTGERLYLESGTRLTYWGKDQHTHQAQIKDKTLELVGDELIFDHPAGSPWSNLRVSMDEPYQVTDPGGKVLWEGGEGLFAAWTPDGGFAVRKETEGLDFYDSTGTKRGSTTENLYIGENDLAWVGWGYGGPVAFYDLKTLRKLGDLSYGTFPSLSPDKKMVALATRQSVVILDVPATLQSGKMVWWKP